MQVSWVPAFNVGVVNSWLFMIVFPLQWLVVLLAPKQFAARTAHPADLERDRKGKIIGRLTEIFWIGATLYSIFLPLHAGTPWFYAGLGIFVAGLAVLALATFSVARTAPGEPFTAGIYRFSRHPMYLSMILVYTGVSVASISWLFLLITVITFFLQRSQMIEEEAYCCRKFGSAYRGYMGRTPRWIGLPG